MGKLVRDRIPEIMRQQGKSPVIETIEGETLRLALKDKLVEEAMELRSGVLTEELVDVLEVIDELIDSYGLDRREIEAVRERKREERGGFKKGFFLLH